LISKPSSNNLNARLADRTSDSHLSDVNILFTADQLSFSALKFPYLLTYGAELFLRSCQLCSHSGTSSLLSAIRIWRMCMILLKCSDTGTVSTRASVSYVAQI
jgi:hypothetical protein